MAYKVQHDALIELRLALARELNMNIIQMSNDKLSSSAKKELASYIHVAPTENSLRYNDERVINNVKLEDIYLGDLDGFDQLVKLKTDEDARKENIDQMLTRLVGR